MYHTDLLWKSHAASWNARHRTEQHIEMPWFANDRASTSKFDASHKYDTSMTQPAESLRRVVNPVTVINKMKKKIDCPPRRKILRWRRSNNKTVLNIPPPALTGRPCQDDCRESNQIGSKTTALPGLSWQNDCLQTHHIFKFRSSSLS